MEIILLKFIIQKMLKQQKIWTNEAKLYETLSDDEKNQRILQLKNDFKDLYDQSDATINAVNTIDKNDDNIETIQRLHPNI